MEIFEGLIEELNQIVLTAKKAPLNSQDIVLNKAKMISVVEKLKANFPPEFREASKIVRERDYILQSAKSTASDRGIRHSAKITRESKRYNERSGGILHKIRIWSTSCFIQHSKGRKYSINKRCRYC